MSNIQYLLEFRRILLTYPRDKDNNLKITDEMCKEIASKLAGIVCYLVESENK